MHTGIEPVKEQDSKDPMDGLSKETKEAMEVFYIIHNLIFYRYYDTPFYYYFLIIFCTMVISFPLRQQNIFELNMINCTYAVLRAMYENCDRDDDKLREEVQKR